MKKLISVICNAVTLLVIGVSAAFPYAIYDWVTTAPGGRDAGYTVRGEWRITDEEFNAGVFSTERAGDAVTGTIEAVLTGGGKLTVPLASLTPTAFTGTLSGDRKSIESIYFPMMGSNFAAIFDAAPESNLLFYRDFVAGRLSTGLYFSGNSHAANDPDLTGIIAQEGRWELRDSVAVPESSGLVLFLVGIGCLALWKRKAPGKVPGAAP